MKTIIIYCSSTGFTKKYADWIAEKAGGIAVSAKTQNVNLSEYDTVIYGGNVFAGTISGLKQFAPKLKEFSGKKIIYACGAMPKESTEQITTLFDNSLKASQLEGVDFYYLQGGLDYTQMSFIHRIMMKMMCSMLKKQNGANSAEYKTISQSFDATSIENLAPLLAALQ